MPVTISVHRTAGSLCCRTPYSPVDPSGILGGTGPADSAQRDCYWRQTEPNHHGLLGEQQAGGKKQKQRAHLRSTQTTRAQKHTTKTTEKCRTAQRRAGGKEEGICI